MIAKQAMRRAHAAVRHAVRTGQLVRPERCPQCGGGGPIEAHHPDYSAPLDVRWLCRTCHRQLDPEPQARPGRAGTPPGEHMTLADAAEWFGVSEFLLYRALAARKLTRLKRGGDLRTYVVVVELVDFFTPKEVGR